MSIHKRTTTKGTRYDVKLRRPDGTQYQKTFKTKKEAETFERDEQHAVQNGHWLDDRFATITFQELANRWLKSNPTKRQTTLTRDQGIIRNHLNPAFGDMPVRAIRRAHVVDLINALIEQELAPPTIVRIKAVLGSIFNLAIAEDIIHKSPTFKVPTPRVDPNHGHPLSPTEAQLLLETIPEHFFALVYIMLTTGIRWSEAAGLQIKHFQPMASLATLTIEQGLHYTPKGTRIEKTKSKASNRVLPLTAEQVNVLSKHLTKIGRTGANADEPLFVSPEGKHLNYANFRNRIWTPTVESIGLSDVTIKDLRKTVATNLAQAGVDIKTTTSIMGHEHIGTTMRHYARTTAKSMLTATDCLISAISSQDVERQEKVT